jgi:hypothetical protein
MGIDVVHAVSTIYLHYIPRGGRNSIPFWEIYNLKEERLFNLLSRHVDRTLVYAEKLREEAQMLGDETLLFSLLVHPLYRQKG